jgi:hypothetical protein
MDAPAPPPGTASYRCVEDARRPVFLAKDVAWSLLMMRQSDEVKLCAVIRRGIDAHSCPKNVAAMMGVGYSTLMNQLNPDVEHQPLSVKNLVAYMLRAGDKRPMRLLASMLGGVFVDMEQPALTGPVGLVETAGGAMTHGSDAVVELLRSMEPDSDDGPAISLAEAGRIIGHANAQAEQATILTAAVKAVAVKPKDERRVG